VQVAADVAASAAVAHPAWAINQRLHPPARHLRQDLRRTSHLVRLGTPTHPQLTDRHQEKAATGATAADPEVQAVALLVGLVLVVAVLEVLAVAGAADLNFKRACSSASRP
jgi:hypothetical protein